MEATKADDVLDVPENDASASLAQSRSRRQRVDKTGRSAAFERLREAKKQGIKHKFELEEKNVYDVVEESEYSDMVRQRQEDDWIVDDDGAGYVEDGREIFDDDMDEESVARGEGKKEGGKKNKNIVRPGTKPAKPKRDIKSMFAAAATSSKTKSEKDVSIAGDDMLGDLMAELDQRGGKRNAPTLLQTGKSNPTPRMAAKKAVNPFSVKSGTPKPVVVAKKEVISARSSSELPASHGKKSQERKMIIKEEPPELDDMDYEIEQVESQADHADKENHQHENAGVEMELNDIDFDDDELGMKQEVSVDGVRMSDGSQLRAAVKSEPAFSGWESMWGNDVDQVDSMMSVQVDSSELPLVIDEDGKQVLRMYWLDAYEDPFKQPGTVYLFGKVWIESARTHVSCCLAVKNIQRCLYLLPRPTRMDLKMKSDTNEPVRMQDVYQEFSENITQKYKIMTFKSRPVSKKYAFEKTDVPVESDYLEVKYSADLPALPSDLQGETFSHVFGANTSSLEHLLLDRKMKGPCWLDLYNVQPSHPPVSWCKVEAVIQRPDHVTLHSGQLAPPPLVLMTLSLCTLPNPTTRQNEVIGAALLVHNDFHMDRPAPKSVFQQHFAMISKPHDCIFPYNFRDRVKQENKKMKVDVWDTERSLLEYLLGKFHKIDPDLVVGHDIYGFDLDILLHRISANKIKHWSKIGRLNRSVMPKLSGGFGRATSAEKSAVCGRLLADVKISARELIRCRSYDLTELVSHILHLKHVQFDYDEIRDMYSSSPQLLHLVELLLMDSTYILKILYELNVIPLALQITNICGNIMGRTLMGGRSERNEYLLLHAFKEKGFICPDKEYRQKNKHVEVEDEGNDHGAGRKGQHGHRKPAYTGGLVLDPKRGFYDKYILLLDFNSLYPSIIQEYNICFTTISRTEQQKSNYEEEDDLNLMLPSSDLESGILPTEIRKLVESRRQVKQLMKAADVTQEQLMQYDIRQKALKLTANSMYGCLGFTFSRFYAKPLAALVTGKGREILMKTKQLVEGMGLEVIYGDTDSIMVNSNSTDMEQVYRLGNKVKAEVNKLYRLLEIDIDGIFKSMLLLKKKKYAALSVVRNPDGSHRTEQELKGLDIVRRDWCDLAKKAGNFVVSQILSGESRETVVENIHAKLTEVGQQVHNGELPLELFQINKQLTKNPEDYPDKKNQSHVQVALRLNSKGGKKLRAGDTVAYIICVDGSNLSATQRAYHPEELAKNEALKLDVHYYLAHQIHPVVSRLCDPIEGTDAAHIAECLGLDPSGYRHSQHHHSNANEEDALLVAQMTEEEKYRDCERFKFICPAENCGRENTVDCVFTAISPESTEKGMQTQAQTGYVLAQCQNEKCSVKPYEHVVYLQNLLVQSIRAQISKYYAGWLKCEDSACGTRTRKLPLTFQRGHPVCAACKRCLLHQEYSDSMLYTQLSFYQYIFDVEKAETLITSAERMSAKSQLQKEGKALAAVYRTLKSTVDSWQRENGYSQVCLNKIFQDLFLFKSEK